MKAALKILAIALLLLVMATGTALSRFIATQSAAIPSVSSIREQIDASHDLYGTLPGSIRRAFMEALDRKAPERPLCGIADHLDHKSPCQSGLALFATRLLSGDRARIKATPRHTQELLLYRRLRRNSTWQEQLSLVLASASFAHGYRGLLAASNGYLRIPGAELSPRQAEVLAEIMKYPSSSRVKELGLSPSL